MFPIEHQAQFDKLRSHFLAGLPAREAEIEDMVADLLAHGPSRTTLQQLFIETHKLSGICATYGLVSLGKHAEAAEALLEPTRTGRPNPRTLEDILLAVDQMTDTLRQVTQQDC